jgi:hypothetical protein
VRVLAAHEWQKLDYMTEGTASYRTFGVIFSERFVLRGQAMLLSCHIRTIT